MSEPTLGTGILGGGTLGHFGIDTDVILPQLLKPEGIAEIKHGELISGITYLIPNNGHMWVRVEADTEDTLMTVILPTRIDGDLAPEPKEYEIGIGTTLEVGPFPQQYYNLIRYLEVQFDNTVGVKASFIKLPRITT